MQEQYSEMAHAKKSTEAAKVAARKLAKEYYQRAITYAEEGKHVAWGMAGISTELLPLFDIAGCWPENFGTVCAAYGTAVHFIEVAEADGYANELCSYMRVGAGYSKEFMDGGGKIPKLSPRGGLPRPTMFLTNSYVCDPRIKAFQAYAGRFWDVPMFTQDIPNPPYGTDFRDAKVKEYYVQHILDELKKMVAFLEDVTGKKYDKDRLIEILTDTQETERLFYEIGELRSAIPCPFPSEDYFGSIVMSDLFMMGERSVLEFAKELYNEVRERVEKKVGVLTKGEEFRVGTQGIPPWYCMGFFNYLESQGIVGVIDGTYYRGKPLDVDLSDPLHALAEKTWLRIVEFNSYGDYSNAPEPASMGAAGNMPAGMYLTWVDKYKLDGVVLFYTRSCRAFSVGQIHLKRRLKEVGIPTMTLEMDMADPRQWSDELVKEQVNSFKEILQLNKTD